MTKQRQAWDTLDTEIIHKNPWYQLKHDKYVLPNGKTGDFYIVDTDQSVFVAPVKDGKFIFVEQYRYPIKKTTLEFPGGGVKKENSLLETAEEELLEEAGYLAKFKEIGKFVPLNGVCNEICTVFLAKDLKFQEQKNEETEYIKIVEIEIKKAYQMLEEGKIIDGMTIASMALVRKQVM